MGRFVQPKVFMVGSTNVDPEELRSYLAYTNQTEFMNDIQDARNVGITWAEIMTSLFAKLCYKSIVPGKNANVSKTRSIKKNLESCFDTAHGSVFEHFNLNFIITDCSRVFTHELVRHRAGTAFSQTSGRYCRLDSIDLVLDPILEPVKDLINSLMWKIEDVVYLMECRLGLRRPNPDHMADMEACITRRDEEGWTLQQIEEVRWVPDDSFDFEKRKKLTSAIRRVAPNGQSNEIAFSLNIRALRHIVQLRTARAAEWEVRSVFNQVYHLVREKAPLMFYRAKTREYDGLLEIYGMKGNPYELDANDPKNLEFFEVKDIINELARRGYTTDPPNVRV